MGCFASLGWAWNFQVYDKPRWRTSITMEGVESFLIFIYGVTNVFLEHLSAWGGAWAPQDFEHVAISLLFMGGGSVRDSFPLLFEALTLTYSSVE